MIFYFSGVGNSAWVARKLANATEEQAGFFNDFVSLMRNAWLVGQKKNYKALAL